MAPLRPVFRAHLDDAQPEQRLALHWRVVSREQETLGEAVLNGESAVAQHFDVHRFVRQGIAARPQQAAATQGSTRTRLWGIAKTTMPSSSRTPLLLRVWHSSVTPCE